MALVYICDECGETYETNGHVCSCGCDVFYVHKIPRVKQWEVAVYEIDRAYGGSEEGGWWYTCGNRCATSRRVFNNRNAAVAYANRLDARLDRNKPKYPLSSIAYRGGVYDVQVHPRGEAPAYFPKARPHYE